MKISKLGPYISPGANTKSILILDQNT